MALARQQASLFSQKIDRVAFTTYFLGAVVPLGALAVIVHRFVLPTLTDGAAAVGMIALVGSIAVLSLAAFLILRHMTRQSLTRMDRDNERLEALLGVSSSLAAAQHVTDVTTTAARRSLELTAATAAYLFHQEEDRPAVLSAMAGDDAEKRWPDLEMPLGSLVDLVIEHERPALRGPDDAAPGGGVERFTAAVVPLPGEASGAIAVVRAGAAAAPFASDEVDALSTLAALTAVALHNADLRDAQRNFFSHVTDIIVTALDGHVDHHRGHGQRVAQYANRMGRTLGLDDEPLQRLHFASLLHDIGRLKQGREQNGRDGDRHATLGYRMLARIRLWREIAPIVHHHHEWYDGSGHPEGLSGDDIPFEARVIAVCDAFDSMTSGSSRRSQLSIKEAIAELENGAGTQFDPELVSIFKRLLDEGIIVPG
jgi:putative nucleotidyltransferase with HDIG domain